jgi:hypothetical protein
LAGQMIGCWESVCASKSGSEIPDRLLFLQLSLQNTASSGRQIWERDTQRGDVLTERGRSKVCGRDWNREREGDFSLYRLIGHIAGKDNNFRIVGGRGLQESREWSREERTKAQRKRKEGNKEKSHPATL